MTAIELLDRTDLVRDLNLALRIDPARTAVLTIDMHRGHLDPAIATMRVEPDDAAVLVERTAQLLRHTRAAGIASIHSVTVRREQEAARPNPFPKAVGAAGHTLAPGLVMNPARHNIMGEPQCELMPDLGGGDGDGDYLLANKKQFSSFHATDLDHLIRLLDLDTLVLAGVGTNTCILSTALDAYNRGLRVVVISDCTTSLNGADLHEFALNNMQRTIGWVLTADEFADRLTDEDA